VSFSKTAAKELAREKIRVNTILPGFIETPMSLAVPEKVRDKILTQIPLGTFGQPDDIADMVVFLASDRSKYVTGAAIEVSGGYCM
jgi:NAD(P)-dependent dehydrogenase (short-subunit alcohol dehydrogenase family)